MGDLVDALDKSSLWRIGKVVQIDEKSALIHFVGWENKWNEVIPLETGKLKPFRFATSFDTTSAKGEYEGRSDSLLTIIDEVAFFHSVHRSRRR